MRVRDRYERRGGSMDDVSVPPCLSDDRRSANRVVEEQVLLLRQMGFRKHMLRPMRTRSCSST